MFCFLKLWIISIKVIYPLWNNNTNKKNDINLKTKIFFFSYFNQIKKKTKNSCIASSFNLSRLMVIWRKKNKTKMLPVYHFSFFFFWIFGNVQRLLKESNNTLKILPKSYYFCLLIFTNKALSFDSSYVFFFDECIYTYIHIKYI